MCDYHIRYTFFETGALFYLEHLEMKLIYGLKCQECTDTHTHTQKLNDVALNGVIVEACKTM